MRIRMNVASVETAYPTERLEQRNSEEADSHTKKWLYDAEIPELEKRLIPQRPPNVPMDQPGSHGNRPQRCHAQPAARGRRCDGTFPDTAFSGELQVPGTIDGEFRELVLLCAVHNIRQSLKG